MADLNKQALEMWNSMKPMIDREIEQETKGTVQRRKAKVTTAPSLVTNTIGVTEPFGTEMFLPFNTNIMSASVGDFVWVEYMYGMTNAFVSMFASADDKNRRVAGNLTVDGVLDVIQRRCDAAVSTAAWYRVFDYNAANEARVSGDIAFLIDITILEWARQSHKITLYGLLGALKFGDEVSVTGTSFVDKIRYVKSGNHGYIDIHYSSSVSRYIACYYDVKCVYVDNLNRFSATTPTMVGDSPSGETVLTEYTFAENTAGTASLTAVTSRGAITSGEAVYVGRMIHLNFIFTASTTATNSPQIASVPNALYDTALSAIDITSGIGSAITSAIPCGVSTLGRVYLQSITNGHIYAITGDYLV